MTKRLIADAAKELVKTPPSYYKIFNDVMSQYAPIVQAPIDKQIQQWDRLQPLLPYVLFVNAVRDVGETIGKDVRKPADYDFITKNHADLVETRIESINKFITEGWLRVGEKAKKIAPGIDGFTDNQLADLDIYISTYLKYAVAKADATEFFRQHGGPNLLEANNMLAVVPFPVVAVLETQKLPPGPVPPRA